MCRRTTLCAFGGCRTQKASLHLAALILSQAADTSGELIRIPQLFRFCSATTLAFTLSSSLAIWTSAAVSWGSFAFAAPLRISAAQPASTAVAEATVLSRLRSTAWPGAIAALRALQMSVVLVAALTGADDAMNVGAVFGVESLLVPQAAGLRKMRPSTTVA